MCRASAVIGNSSSGLIEAPSFGVPTIDIGTRQRGRLCADSVMHCPPTTEGIAVAIAQALTPEFGRLCKSASNPYGEGDASRQIVRKLEGLSFPGSKRFFDLESTS
jgi:UDP-N-acetylglucosamine 2-epimerase (non-hydrolysing)